MTDALDCIFSVYNEDNAAEFAAALVRNSIQFWVEPYPYDEWVFHYKREAQQIVARAWKLELRRRGALALDVAEAQ